MKYQNSSKNNLLEHFTRPLLEHKTFFCPRFFIDSIIVVASNKKTKSNYTAFKYTIPTLKGTIKQRCQ